MGSPPTEQQRPADDERPTGTVVSKPDEPAPARAGSAPDEAPGSPPRPHPEPSDRTARYLMGPTAFCA